MLFTYLYKKQGGKQKRLNFLLDLGEPLIGEYGPNVKDKKDRRRSGRTPDVSRFIGRHFPAIIPPTSKPKPTKRCTVCSKTGRRKESRYWCRECYVGLCAAPCFGIYHSKS